MKKSSAGVLLFILLALTGCSLFRSDPKASAPLAAPSQVTVFQDVNLFAGTSTAAVAHQDVWVQNGMIAYVGPAGVKMPPFGANAIPGSGMTLLPGLIDLHTHTSGDASPPWDLSLPDPDANMRAYLRAGITTVADLGGSLDGVSERREAVRSGKLQGPTVLMAGPHFTAHDGHPIAMMRAFVPWPFSMFVESQFGFQADTTEEVAAYFPKFLSYKPDMVKITSDQIPLGIPTLRPEVAAYIVARAHAAGLKVFAHVGSNDDARKMALAGVDILAHNPYRDRLSDEVAELIAQKGIQVEPTLAVFDASDRLAAGDLVLSDLDRKIGAPSVVAALDRGAGDYKTPQAFDGWLRAVHENRQIKVENVRTLRRHGVKILVGSDAPSLGHFAGSGLHHEMELLVETGLTPGDILKAVTHDNACAVGLDEETGSIAVGKRADLLLVNGDPTVQIGDIHRIEAVYKAGTKVAEAIR